MRQFQASDFSAERSGKCALFMPKELAFQQPSRNRRTVELDETAILSQTHTVDGASDEFLPVPVSPRINTVASLCATVLASLSTRFSGALSPTRSSELSSERMLSSKTVSPSLLCNHSSGLSPRADRIPLSKACSVNGLGRKSTAPASRARARVPSLGEAVMKIIGMRYPRSAR